jgi:hypothetical protein
MTELDEADVDALIVARTSAAGTARAAALALLEGSGIEASSDAGAFFPQPVGVLVGLPTLVSRTLAARTFELPVTVVSGDPLNSELAVDRLYALADDVAGALRTFASRPTSWRGGVNAEPLPAIELTATLTISEEATQ